MKLILSAVAAMFCAGCVAKDLAIEVTNAEVLDGTCSGSPTLFRSSGFLCWNFTNNYLAQFGVNSNLETPKVQAGNDTVSNANVNDFVTDEIDFTYTSIPAATFAAEADLGFHFVIPAGAVASNSFFGEALLQQKARDTITALMTTNNSIRVLVNFQLQGHLISGAHITSNDVTFPVDIDATCAPAVCPPPSTTPPTFPCGNTGQDTPICQ